MPRPAPSAAVAVESPVRLLDNGKRDTLEGFERSHFYSDSQNDIPLLSLVTDPVATNPNARLAAHAQVQGWPTLQLFHD